MKSFSVICFFLLLAMIVCPLASVEKAKQVFLGEAGLESEELQAEESASISTVSTVKVMNANSKNITELSLEDYLLGVVAEEMSASYHEEAIKAQIIAAHTLLEHSKLTKSEELGDADITDSPATHQGFFTVDEQKAKWGEKYDEYVNKIKKCIEEVKDVTIQYNDKPITAVFYAISNGQTENATDVWGGNYPYLVSVSSEGDKLSPGYLTEVSFSSDEFKKIITEQGATLSDKPENWIGEIKHTDTGMVKEIAIGDKVFKGTDIRKLFSLRSSTFECEYKDGAFIFKVKGYGHGVGMSQYGANCLAQEGKTYQEILAHYYPNTELKSC